MITHASTSFFPGPCFRGGRFVRMPYQRSPDREKSIERRKRLAATQPLRPAMAARAKLTISQLAYARLIADDNLIAGDSRETGPRIEAAHQAILASHACRIADEAAMRMREKLAARKPEHPPRELEELVASEWACWFEEQTTRPA